MNIMVIKLGALGDVVLAFQPFADIRAHHREARITLLTTQPFAALLQDAPWFDEIRIDSRPPWWSLAGLLGLRRNLQGFDLVYDLQTSGRSSKYHRLAGRPPWSGIARGASHRHTNPARNRMHTVDRQRDQLAMAGVPPGPKADLAWLTHTEASGARAGGAPDRPYALLIPGAAPHRPAKRWPARQFAALAEMLHANGLIPVVAGTAAETPLAAVIQAACPRAIDLTGRTTLQDLAALAARATVAIGNDTGPMHLAAAVGCPGLVLFGPDSDPDLTAPRGRMTVLRVPHLPGLSPQRVAAALAEAHTIQPSLPPEPLPCPP